MVALTPLGALVRRVDPDRFLCTLFAPADRRETLFTLIAFNHELARAREVTREPMMALIRLQWWRDIVEGARRSHEVATPLRDALDAGRLYALDLLRMIAGREIEASPAIPTLSAWLDYLRETAGTLAAASGRVLGADPATLERLERLGAAYGAAGVLRSVPAHARQGRCLLPAEVLAAQGSSPDAIIANPDLTGIRPVLAAEAAGLLAAGGPFPRHAISAALPAVLARIDLARQGNRVGRPLGDQARLLIAALRSRI